MNIKLFHLSCHNLLRKKFGLNNKISRKEVYEQLGRHFLIPKNLRDVAIKELEQMSLLKKIDRDNIILLECEFDIETDANKFYRSIGFF